MKLNFSSIADRTRRFAFYIPFTIYFLVFAVAALLGWQWLKKDNPDAGTAFFDIFSLLLRITLYFGLAFIVLSLVSVAVPFAYMLYHKKRGVTVKIDTDLKESTVSEKQVVRLLVSPVMKPLFGFIKLRLLYDQQHYSRKFSLLEKSQRAFFSKTIEGTYNWTLPEIKEYHVQSAVLYFEDVFQFFSFAVNLPANSRFFTQPSLRKINDLNTLPRKTEDTTTRIEQMRKVEGEYLNYKNFENNDDVRRIVWKIYAKNKELVVRVPEIMDPYASHLYLYASFFSKFSVEGNSAVEVPFLNFYKVMVWTIFDNLSKQQFLVRYQPDQDVSKRASLSEEQAVKFAVSTAHWQRTTDLKTYLKPADASVVIVSSLSDPDEVQELAERYSRDITFVFIRLTDAFKTQNVLEWVQWLFVHNEKDDIDVYKRSWALSPLRLAIKENEQRLTKILDKYQEPVKL